jgi:hypothetical protein
MRLGRVRQRWRTWRASRLGAALGPYLALVPGLVAYGVLRVVFAHVVGSQGFVTPSGSPNKALAAFALVMLVMRITVIVGVPLVVTYRLVVQLSARLRPR